MLVSHWCNGIRYTPVSGHGNGNKPLCGTSIMVWTSLETKTSSAPPYLYDPIWLNKQTTFLEWSPLWHTILTLFLTYHLEVHMDTIYIYIYKYIYNKYIYIWHRYILTFYLTFCPAYALTFYLASFQAFILAFSLARVRAQAWPTVHEEETEGVGEWRKAGGDYRDHDVIIWCLPSTYLHTVEYIPWNIYRSSNPFPPPPLIWNTPRNIV